MVLQERVLKAEAEEEEELSLMLEKRPEELQEMVLGQEMVWDEMMG